MDATAGWKNCFLTCCFWALCQCVWRGVELRQWAASHCPPRLLLEGVLIQLLLGGTFLLCAVLSVGRLCGASATGAASYLAQGVGSAGLLYGPIYWVRFGSGSAWPFLTRLALCMQGAVLLLKFSSLVATRRAMEALGEGAAAAGEEAAASGGVIDGRSWARAPAARPSATRGVAGFARFLFSPALVYDPRPPLFLTFSPSVLAEKLLLGGALIMLMVSLHERFLAEAWARAGERDVATSFFEAVLPLQVLSILLFFTTFDCVTGAAAEVTGFADRFSYADWWASTTFAEFARRWNRPVGDWLRAVSCGGGGPPGAGVLWQQTQRQKRAKPSARTHHTHTHISQSTPNPCPPVSPHKVHL